jgi:hypothetical protein
LNVRDIYVWSGYGSLFHGKLREVPYSVHLCNLNQKQPSICRYIQVFSMKWIGFLLLLLLLLSGRRIFFDQRNYIFDNHVTL